jgi:ribosomal protein S18 acetylase RimI-like enzyme
MSGVRPARLDDLDALVAFNRAMAAETEGLELDPGTLREGVLAVLEGRAPALYRVIEDDGGVAGQLMVTFEWSDWRARQVWWVQSVYVAPRARRRGLYRRLYAAVMAEAEAAGAAGVRLYVDARNAAAQEVYRRLGMDGDHYRVFERMFGSGQDLHNISSPSPKR